MGSQRMSPNTDPRGISHILYLSAVVSSWDESALPSKTPPPVCLNHIPHPQSFSLGAQVTHSNRIAASAKNFLSKSQRKKRSRLERKSREVWWGLEQPRTPGKMDSSP